MAQPKWSNKNPIATPEVNKIFNDLESWLNYCRFHLINYDPADLYKSIDYRGWQERRRHREMKRHRENQDPRFYRSNNRFNTANKPR